MPFDRPVAKTLAALFKKLVLWKDTPWKKHSCHIKLHIKWPQMKFIRALLTVTEVLRSLVNFAKNISLTSCNLWRL